MQLCQTHLSLVQCNNCSYDTTDVLAVWKTSQKINLILLGTMTWDLGAVFSKDQSFSTSSTIWAMTLQLTCCPTALQPALQSLLKHVGKLHEQSLTVTELPGWFHRPTCNPSLCYFSPSRGQFSGALPDPAPLSAIKPPVQAPLCFHYFSSSAKVKSCFLN